MMDVMSFDAESVEALKQFREVYEEKRAVVNGREYCMLATTHKNRLAVFAFFSSLGSGGLAWLQSKEWAAVQKIIDNAVTYEGSLLSKREKHWEEYEEDFLMLYMAMMGAFSFPFLRGSLRDSTSQNPQEG